MPLGISPEGMTRNAAWLEQQNIRVLHVGNIVNNGYNNAKFLREAGLHNDVLSYDYFHAQSMPEWEDADFDAKVPEWEPDWSRVDLKGYARPGWFYNVYMEEIPQLFRSDKPFVSQRAAISRQKKMRVWFNSCTPAWIQKPLKKYYQHWKDRRRLETYGPQTKSPEMDPGLIKSLQEDYRSFFKDGTQLSAEDFDYARYKIPFFRDFFNSYQLIHAYGLESIHAMMAAPKVPMIAFEHGTMRDFPFQQDARARLYSLSLKKAKVVLITNSDNIKAAKRLGLSNYRFIPHPVDDEIVRSTPSDLGAELKKRYKVDYLFLAPARHHWKHCPSGMENSWLKRNDILIRAFGELFQKHRLNALVLFCSWGQEVELSKKLIEQCGFSDRAVWLPILSKRALVRYYTASDIVFDQFNGGIGTFGTVAPEAMACGKPVLLNWNPDLHTWCWPELPPLLNTATESDIVGQVLRLIQNPEYRQTVGESGRAWFQKYHSKKVVQKILFEAYEQALKEG